MAKEIERTKLSYPVVLYSIIVCINFACRFIGYSLASFNTFFNNTYKAQWETIINIFNVSTKEEYSVHNIEYEPIPTYALYFGVTKIFQ